MQQVALELNAERSPGSILLYDGLTANMLDRYMGAADNKQSSWPYLESGDLGSLSQSSHVFFVVNPSQPQQRSGFNRFLRLIGADYALQSAQVALPAEVFGLEFQDLTLPIRVTLGGPDVERSGSIAMSNAIDDKTRVLKPGQPASAD
jgi:hypothetical protein